MKVWMTLAACALSTLMIVPVGSAAAEGTMKDGVLWVENGAEPANGRRDVHLDEMWRVGGEDSEDFFGLISDALFDDAGNLYLLDTRLAEVPVYAPDGERLNTLSREGDGPGETRMPSKILFMPDGSLGIAQIFPGKIVKVGTDDSPQGTWELNVEKTEGGFIQFFDVLQQGANLVIMAEQIEQRPPAGQLRTRYAASYDMEGNELARYEAHPQELDFTQFNWVEDEVREIDFRHTVAGPDGRVYVSSERNAYQINVYKPEGGLDRVITRSFEHFKRDQAEIDRINSQMETRLTQLPNPQWTVSKTEPDISALRIGPDGNLWVESSQGGVGQPEGVFFTWDVFDADGVFVEQVSAHCPGDGREDMMLWRGDMAVQVTGFLEGVRSIQGGGGGPAGDEDAKPMEIICYKVVGG